MSTIGTARIARADSGAFRYQRHQPEKTLLYQLVLKHYPNFRRQLAEEGRVLPDYVQREFEEYLKCGRLEHGFLRVRCETCHEERLVAFSCKRRGFCPSCGARRMAESSALLYANLANYAVAVEGKHFYGVRQGEKAYKYHKKLRRLHPEIHDTGVVLGVRDYVTGSLPRMHRFLLFFLGAGGNRQRGLEYLEAAAERGEFLRTYARVLLSVARIREGELEGAARVLETLHADYPRNSLFSLELARLYRTQRRYRQAVQACRELVAELIIPPTSPRILGPEDAFLELGRAEAAAGNLDAALESFHQVVQIDSADKKVITWALLEQGQIFDQRGEREKALSKYEHVIRLAADPEAIRLANAHKEAPYRAKGVSHREVGP